MAPARGVEGRAVEVLETRERRHGRHRELSAGRDEDVGLVVAGAGLQDPAAALRVPGRPLDLRSGADPVQHTVASRDVLEVVLDLGLGGVAPRPAGVWLEGEFVEVRRDVAGRTRIRVVVPDATHALAALEDRDVLVPRPPQHHDRADAAETAADHGDRARATAVAVAPVRARDRAHVAELTSRRARVLRC